VFLATYSADHLSNFRDRPERVSRSIAFANPAPAAVPDQQNCLKVVDGFVPNGADFIGSRMSRCSSTGS